MTDIIAPGESNATPNEPESSPEITDASPDTTDGSPEITDGSPDTTEGNPENKSVLPDNTQEDDKSEGEPDGQDQPWWKPFEESHKDFLTDRIKEYKDPAELAKGYVELQRHLRSKGAIPPDADSSPDDVAAWNSQIGVPNKPEEYGEVSLKDESLQEYLNEDSVSEIQSVAHELGLTKYQYTKLAEAFASNENARLEEAKKEHDLHVEKVTAELQQAYGHQFKDKMKEVSNFIDAQNQKNPGLWDAIKESNLHNNPQFIKMVEGITQQLKPDSMSRRSMSPSDLKSEHDRLQKLYYEMEPGSEREKVRQEYERVSREMMNL